MFKMLDFKAFLQKYGPSFEQEMLAYISQIEMPAHLKDAMLYSLEAGGKRIRPMLILAVLKAYRLEPMLGLDAGIAVELIHTYSLIHDDLPCMDNDDLRRGKPTNHRVFGESMAVLAGDALQPAAFGKITDSEIYSAEQKIALISALARAAGASGMVGGQVADIEAENIQVNIEQLKQIHALKTGKLLEFSIQAGAILANASTSDQQHLSEFARHLGIAFQIQDDILDIVGNEAELGKPIGSDLNNQKSTYPSLLTIEGALAQLNEHHQKANSALKKVNCNVTILESVMNMVVNRNN